MKHPIQPLAPDEAGTVRFKANAIVRFLVDKGPYSLHDLAIMDFPREDWEQLAQLIGYSLSGFGDLSYVSEDTYAAAEQMAEGVDERDARIVALEETLAAVRGGLRVAAVAAFHVHPDDLAD